MGEMGISSGKMEAEGNSEMGKREKEQIASFGVLPRGM